MSEQKHIHYSASDIDRYLQGGMTAGERHALEKAALEDPFLADALEGYAIVPVSAEEDIKSLERKLENRISKKKEGAVITPYLSKLPWLRIAALFILIVGAGLLTYQFVLKGKTTEVAKTERIALPESNPKAADTPKPAPVAAHNNGKATDQSKKVELTASKEDAINTAGAAPLKDTVIISANRTSGRVVVVPEKVEEEKNVAQNTTVYLKKGNEAVAQSVQTKKEVLRDADEIKDARGINTENKKILLSEVVVNRNLQERSSNTANIFRGQVLDTNNNPLPFANVTNIRDNVGTYTDVKGNFVLLSPDTTLDVKVRSVGFENRITQLRNSVSGNAVILQQDIKNVPATVMNNGKSNTDRKRADGIMVAEEPEPSDGWSNYDTYLANNIKVPEEIKTKTVLSSDVELSFSINKNGEPVNIKVEKSVCKECDAEAIRLLKEGPKWKKKNKNARAKVAVSF